MSCKNHPNVMAVGRCEGCAESFCSDCLVNIGGSNYCGSCKSMALGGIQPQVRQRPRPCPEAGSALTTAIIGLFCFGIILGPIAISKALKAKDMISRNPNLTGSGKATAALIIGIIDIAGFVIGMAVRIAAMNAHH